jgi:hypothetical protein
MDIDQYGRDEHKALMDMERTAFLYDVGAPDHAATIAVDAAGNERLWVVDLEQLNDADADVGNANQRHERLGRLPQAVRDRIWGDSLRCGRPTCSGRPCRIRVANPGDPCGTHAKPRCAGCGLLMYCQGGVWGCFGCHPDGRGWWNPIEVPS